LPHPGPHLSHGHGSGSRRRPVPRKRRWWPLA
jgi:hypothetical protein